MTMSPSSAMRRCWVLWGISVALCGGAVGTVLAFGTTGDPIEIGVAWYVVVGFVYAIVIPLCGLIHWRLFRQYWANGVVRPEGYLKAFVALWIGLTLSVISISVLGIVRHSSMPELALALPPALMLMGTWPTGWAMTDRTESDDGAATMEEEELLHVHSET